MNPTTPKVVTVNESDLECPLCRDILFEPYTIQKCSHTICGLCVQRKEYKIAYVHGSLEPRQCPFCRVDLGAMPVVYRNLFLAGLCESSYWNLPEHNDKRREKQAEFDRLRAERKRDGEAAKREREQAQRKRSFAEFKAELNKLITYRGDILDPECMKKARMFVDKELRMLPVVDEGPVPPAAAPIVDQGPPYSDVIVSLMKNSVRTKTLAIARVQSQWYVHGFLDEIERHVPQLQGIKNEVQEIYQVAVTIEQHTQVGLGRSAARSWLLASFPFVKIAPVTVATTEEKKSPSSSVPEANGLPSGIIRELEDEFSRIEAGNSSIFVRAFLRTVEQRVPQLASDIQVLLGQVQDRELPVNAYHCARAGTARALLWLAPRLSSAYLSPPVTP